MAAHDHLHPRQFGKKAKHDPMPDKKPAFSGVNSSKTMRVESGHLPSAPKVHPHRRHAGVRSHRAK